MHTSCCEQSPVKTTLSSLNNLFREIKHLKWQSHGLRARFRMISTSATRQIRILLFMCCAFFFLTGNVLPDELKESLPFCGLVESSNNYVFVSTLDGKLTALNPDEGGSVVWSVNLGSEPMLSCSIHKLELTNYGHLVRMIPSLSGGLYKFNGESIEAIPITVEHLLQASFKYSDDLVISGGKESQTYGVSLQSGKILYECSMKGCENASRTNNVGDILVIQRLGQTVRAVEPRTGSERWNFSVAQHDLRLLSECHGQDTRDNNFELKVVVPEGLICAMDKDKKNILWKHRFNSPIVSAWQIRKGRLFMIDLFSGFQPDKLDMVISPSLYIGMHEKQLYIQESVMMEKMRQEITSKVGQNLIASDNNDGLSIPWKPVSASRNAAGLIAGKVGESMDEVSQRQTTALSVLYASAYVDGNGFYLYPEQQGPKELVTSLAPTDDGEGSAEEETPVQIVIVSLWYWWKEVLVISLTTALLLNVMFTRRFPIRRRKEFIVDSSSPVLPVKASDSGIDLTAEKSTESKESQNSSGFTSRYLTDFEPVDCLGKGGFGVVFRAKNKIDDCHYAIKRIVLPISQDSRDRVMREVKALAKLDHHHIVRYFNAWTECPPPGWQEDHDKRWVDSSWDISSGLETTSHQRHVPSSSIDSNVIDYRRMSLRGGFPSIENEISDSFIVFEDKNDSKWSSDSKIINKSESVVGVGSEAESMNRGKSNRPKSLAFSERTCDLSCNPNRVYLYIQMQLCQRESLRDWLTSHTSRDYSHVLRIFDQILQAVEHVHVHGLIHRDLKPSNIFFSLDNEIKVGDFGLVTAMTEDQEMSPCECGKVNLDKEKHTAQVGTQLYMSPEQLSGKHYNYKVDIYSLGLILFELLVPFNSQMERSRVLADIKKDRYPEDFKKAYKTEYELLRLMLSHSPDERPTTYGIRARLQPEQETKEQSWHFDLPTRRRGSSKTSSASRSSSECSAE